MLKVKMSHKKIVESTLNLIERFLMKSPETNLRMSHLWKLIKLTYPNDKHVLYWKLRGREKHGLPPAVSIVLQADNRFHKTKIDSKTVYIKLNRGK